jgi:hypothetical protein
MAATGRCRSPQRYEGPILARADRKAKRPHPVGLRRHPPPAVGGRRRTSTRRSPCRSPLVAHPRTATANAEAGIGDPQRCPSGQTHDRDGARAALAAAPGLRPEPLKPPDTERRADAISGRPVFAHSSATWHSYLVSLSPPDAIWCTAWSQAGEGSREKLRNLRNVMRICGLHTPSGDRSDRHR